MQKILDQKLTEYYLEKYKLFSWHVGNITDIVELHYFKSGEMVFEIGEDAKYLYVLVNGRVKVTYPFENGKSMLLKFYNPIILLGDMELYQSHPIMCSVEVVEDSHLIAVPDVFVQTHWMNNTQFLHGLIESLSEKLSSTINNSSYNFVYPLGNRLASYIVDHLETAETTEEGLYVELKSSFEEISQFLGTTYRHLHRTITEFENKGLIAVDTRRLKIIDETTLRDMAVNKYMKLL